MSSPRALGAVVAVAAGIHLGRASLWLDEALSWSITSHGFSGLLHAYAGDIGGNAFLAPLYFLVLHGWIDTFGTSEAALRSLSLVFAVAAIPVFLALCRCLLRPAVVYVVTALLAVSPFFLDYAREARMYSLAVLLVITSSYCFVRTIEAPASRWWLAFGVVAGLAIYAHLFAAFVLLAQLLSLAFLPRPVQWRPVARAVLVAAAVAAPLTIYLVVKTGGEGVNWIPALSREQIRAFLQTLTGASRRGSVVVVLVVGLAGVVVLYRAWTKQRERLWYVGFPLAWFVIPIVAAAAVSIAKPLFVDRYLIVVLPGFLLTIGVVLDSFVGWRSWLVPVVAGLLVAVSYPGFDRVRGAGDDVRGLEAGGCLPRLALRGRRRDRRRRRRVRADRLLRVAFAASPPRTSRRSSTRMGERKRTAIGELQSRLPIGGSGSSFARSTSSASLAGKRQRVIGSAEQAAHNPHVHRVHRTKNVSIYRYDPP